MANSVTSLKQLPVGEEQEIECKEGYILLGKEKVMCKTHGIWSSLPQCREYGELYQSDISSITRQGCDGISNYHIPSRCSLDFYQGVII